MKTDAIKEVLSELRRLAYAGIYDGEADDAWKDRQSDAVAELTTLEAENAAMREALRTLSSAVAVYCCFGPPEPKPSLAEWGRQLEAVKVAISAADSALTPPTGKAHDAR